MNGVPVNPIKWIPMYRTLESELLLYAMNEKLQAVERIIMLYIILLLFISLDQFFFPLTEFNHHSPDLPRRWRTSLHVRTCFAREQKCKQSISHPWSEIPNIFLYSFVAGSFLSCTRLVKPFREISWMREWKVGFISRRKYFCFEENIKPYLKPFLAEFAERRSAATNFSVDKPQFHRRRNNFRKLPLSLRHFLDTRTRKPPLSTLYPVSRPTTFPIFPTDKSRVRESWNDGWTMTGAVS